MRSTIHRKTPVRHPSQRLPFVRIPVESLGLTGRVSDPYRVHISDHDYQRSAKGTMVKGTALENQAFLGFFLVYPKSHRALNFRCISLALGTCPSRRSWKWIAFCRASRQLQSKVLVILPDAQGVQLQGKSEWSNEEFICSFGPPRFEQRITVL